MTGKIPMLRAACWLGIAANCLAQSAWKIPPRGVAVFDRSELAVVANPRSNKKIADRVVLPYAHTWKYRETPGAEPAPDWQSPEFDDSKWSTGASAFSDSPANSARHRTAWKQRCLYARTEFNYRRRKVRGAVLYITHDDLAQVYLNGQQIYRGEKFLNSQRIVLDEAALAAFARGRNVLAVKATNTGGAARLTVALTVLERAPRSKKDALETAAPSASAANQAIRGILPSWRAPALLFDGDLDRTKTRVATPPTDIRELGWFVATDLSGGAAGKSFAAACPRMAYFGDVKLRIKAEPIREGRQRITAGVKTRRPNAPLDNDRAFVEEHVDKHTKHGIDASIEIERTIDLERGVVKEFRWRLTGMISTPKTGPIDCELSETWTLRAVRENRDMRFRADVLGAIQKAAAYLRKSIGNLNAGPIRGEKKGDRSYGSGTLALTLLAMVKGGIGVDDSTCAAAFAELRKRRIVDTYSLACALMAMESIYAPADERADLLAGIIERPKLRKPSPEDRAIVDAWAKALAKNIDTRLDPESVLRFNYVRGKRFDTSVNQYGLLGLYAAQLCGHDVPSNLWRAAINHLADSQEKPKSKLKLVLGDRESLTGKSKRGATTANTSAAGWGYHEPRNSQRGRDNPIYGSMTCAGITGLAVAQAGLHLAGQHSDSHHAIARAAIRGGFAWLAKHFTVRWNPGYVQKLQVHHYYYLYGIERSCELTNVALINDHDWYFEAATTLMEMQREDGSWIADKHHDDVRRITAMALLVLKKESMPVFTGK